ncbi:MAG: hypothetical protein K6A65_04160, partial [Succinivibrionaceae bacterium]|nr:hypothetical protein [Succinivibrionaceae bacterium]
MPSARLPLALALLLAAAAPGTALPYTTSGWQLSPSYAWRLEPDHGHAFARGSPSRHLRPDRAIPHHDARIVVREDITRTYELRLGCVIQSEVPALELLVSPLDIRMVDLNKGFAFAHFMVDLGTELSLRGEIVPPGRLIFPPYTNSQAKRLSDLFLQLREGGRLSVALLQGDKAQPRGYSFPLDGFMALSARVTESCATLRARGGARAEPLPDYVTEEPEGYAPPKFTMKPQPESSDGLAPAQV